MKVLFLIGNSAVGKMTVGQELTKITDLRLFHNHMTIEPVLDVFGSYQPRVIRRLREVFFEEFAASGLYGLIFTIMLDFDLPSEWEDLAHIRDIFTQRDPDAEFYYAELVAPQEIRLARNATENRLRHKPSKRDVERSAERLLHDDAHHRCESYEGEIPFAHYIRIDTAELSPEAVAKKIKDAFRL